MLRRIVRKAGLARLLSNEHFSGADQPPGPVRNPNVNWHGEKRSNETHVAPKDRQTKLFCKGRGQAAKIVDVEVTEASGARCLRAKPTPPLSSWL